MAVTTRQMTKSSYHVMCGSTNSVFLTQGFLLIPNRSSPTTQFQNPAQVAPPLAILHSHPGKSYGTPSNSSQQSARTTNQNIRAPSKSLAASQPFVSGSSIHTNQLASPTMGPTNYSRQLPSPMHRTAYPSPPSMGHASIHSPGHLDHASIWAVGPSSCTNARLSAPIGPPKSAPAYNQPDFTQSQYSQSPGATVLKPFKPRTADLVSITATNTSTTAQRNRPISSQESQLTTRPTRFDLWFYPARNSDDAESLSHLDISSNTLSATPPPSLQNSSRNSGLPYPARTCRRNQQFPFEIPTTSNLMGHKSDDSTTVFTHTVPSRMQEILDSGSAPMVMHSVLSKSSQNLDSGTTAVTNESPHICLPPNNPPSSDGTDSLLVPILKSPPTVFDSAIPAQHIHGPISCHPQFPLQTDFSQP